MKITFIGGGNMASALISGLRKQGITGQNIFVVEPLETTRQQLADVHQVNVSTGFTDSMLDSDALLLAVKPKQLQQAIQMHAFAEKITQPVVISLAAGVRIATLAHWLGGYERIVRVMPNTPALIGAGMSGLFAAPDTDQTNRQTTETIMSAVGHCLWVDTESMLDAITAISGSGPAYVFYLIEAMEAAAQKLGFSPAEASLLANSTFLGASQLVAGSQESVTQLRERVTSSGGTTEAALNLFETERLKFIFQQGISAAELRSRELGNMFKPGDN